MVYGLPVFYFLSKTLDLFLSPLFWGMLLCGLGMARSRSGGRWLSATGVAMLYAFSIEPTAGALMGYAEGLRHDSFRRGTIYDVVVLLGGVVDHAPTAAHGSRQYNDNVERLLLTYDLLRKGRATKAILSGGRGRQGDPVVEAEALADQLADWGIDRERLIVEGEAKNTRENATLSAQIVREQGFQSVLIVTSAFHMRRALETFEAVDLDVDALSTDYKSADGAAEMSFLPRASRLNESSRAIREIAGRWIYRVVGYGKAVS